MSKIFIDEDGRKWEATMPSVDREHVVIRRLELQEPEWEVTADISIRDKQVIQVIVDVKPDQAEALKEAIEALMEYVHGGGRNGDSSQVEAKLERAYALALIQKGKE